MKLISAIIRPHVIEDVREALTKVGVEGLTLTEVRGFGRQKGQTEIYRGAEYAVSFLPKLKLDVVVGDAMEEKVVEAISLAAKSGKVGDGKIFVVDVAAATRIRTGETGDTAL